ncbi:MAG: hydrogenase, partial [Bacteroidota bacterium]
YYTPTWVEIGIFIGTLGLFSTLFLIFIRVAPAVAVAEIKSILKDGGDQYTGMEVARKHAAEHAGEKQSTH